MARPTYEADSRSMTIRPHLGIGWQTTVDQVRREVAMQLTLFCVRLPIKPRIPYSEVVRVAAISRESWWSWAPVPISGWFGHSWVGGGRRERTEMTGKGCRHDILVTLEGGKTLKVENVKSTRTAKETEQQLRHIVGLPETC
jgi:hypothetical protein